MIVAHRGASHDAPQNTIPAFKLAWEQGADAIEGDFHLTKDGHIVCIHDRDTKKVANANLVVSDSTLAELRQVDVGAWKDQAFAGVLIPTIAEVFSTIPQQKKIYIEVKCGPEIIPALLRGIDQSGLTDEQVVEAVREHGYEWHVWTVNDLEEAERMTALGPLDYHGCAWSHKGASSRTHACSRPALSIARAQHRQTRE